MKVIALTGGIASGKSTVSRILSSEYHFPIIDADLIAREVVAPGSEGIRMIEENFGSDFITENGEMNRSRMEQLIRTDPKARDRLNRITHPLIKKKVEEAIEACRKQNIPIVIYDCPLLFESKHDHIADRIALVTVSPEKQIERLMARDGITAEIAQKKIEMHMPESEKRKLADDLIDNSGNEEDLRISIDQIVKKWVEA